MPFLLSINYMSYAAAVIASMAVGMIWYSPGVMGAKWMMLTGANTDQGKKTNMAKLMILTILTQMVIAYGLNQVLFAFGVRGIVQGLFASFMAWLCFTAATKFVDYLYETRSKKLLLIYIGHDLVSFLVMGAIISAWK